MRFPTDKFYFRAGYSEEFRANRAHLNPVGKVGPTLSVRRTQPEELLDTESTSYFDSPAITEIKIKQAFRSEL